MKWFLRTYFRIIKSDVFVTTQTSLALARTCHKFFNVFLGDGFSLIVGFVLQGDVQMCVSALIVLGDKIRSRIDEQTQEQWLMSYIGECFICTRITGCHSRHGVRTAILRGLSKSVGHRHQLGPHKCGADASCRCQIGSLVLTSELPCCFKQYKYWKDWIL